MSWSFLLEPESESGTRLIVRAKASNEWRDLALQAGSPGQLLFIHRVYRLLARLPQFLMVVLGGIGHTVMERRMLEGIKRRAEGTVP
ncbi:MAG: hypothetical protein GTO63_32110 [Anaerolineae bacterium]|nr:hypothetical protein [Anaerolineae bacterium]NIQ83093.1 hypothetical protein [Anaerolineae bacterium]